VAPDELEGSVFHGETASHYARYRRWYPSELIDDLARRFGGDGGGRLLDLGCGTGHLLLQLASVFDEAVGVDPEPDMLREAARRAAETGVRNVEWVRGASTDLPTLRFQLGRFDLVTVGTAFHYMDPHATLAALRHVVRPGGGVVVAYNGSPMWLHPAPWSEAIRRVLESWLGPVRDADFDARALRDCESAMADLEYAHVERWEHVYESTIDVDFIVGHIYSALSPEQLSSDQRPTFERHLREEVAAVAPSQRVTETVGVRAVIGLR
jgi:ubiquinone/menaquinone biosynthesis C-methylase UbiE